MKKLHLIFEAHLRGVWGAWNLVSKPDPWKKEQIIYDKKRPIYTDAFERNVRMG